MISGRLRLHIVYSLFESHPQSLVEFAHGKIRVQGFLDPGEIFMPGQRASAYRDDATVPSKLAILIAVKKGRQQFTHGQVASAAKNHQVKFLYGD